MFKVLKVLRGLLLKKSPKQGLGQSPKVLVSPYSATPIRKASAEQSSWEGKPAA